MDEPGPETPTIIPQARSDKFSSVTTIGNKCVTALKEANQADPDAMVRKIKEVMPELLQTVVSVTFEKAKLWSVIESNPNLSYYTNMDYDSWMNPGDLNKSDLERAKVSVIQTKKGNRTI